MNSETKIEYARVGTKIVAAVGVERVVNEAVKRITPPSASLPTKIMFKVGGLGIASGICSIVNKNIDETFDTVLIARAEVIKALEETEGDQNDSGTAEETDGEE